MEHRARLDKFGRVLIPKGIREDLGIEPGDSLTIEERENEIALRPASEHPKLAIKGKVLVARVEPTGNLRRVVEKLRRERLSRLRRQA